MSNILFLIPVIIFKTGLSSFCLMISVNSYPSLSLVYVNAGLNELFPTGGN